jgi:hypothetical protein
VLQSPRGLLLPGKPVVELLGQKLLRDRLGPAPLLHGHREPARPLRRLDAGPVLEILALELNVVEKDELVGLQHAVEVAEPREKVRLVRGENHPLSPFVIQ